MKGSVFDGAKRACVKADDRALYERGRALIEAGHYQLGLAILESISDRSDPSVLAMIGYAKRRVGRINEGIAHFREALALDPMNAVARGYLGETYVFIGRIDLARAELGKIESICGTTCDQYVDLAADVARETSRPPVNWHRRADW